jgi:hypothetical protein
MTPELTVGQSALLTDVAMCVNYYRLLTPGLYCCTLVPVQLDQDTRLCPGLMAMVNYGKSKQCAVDPFQQCFTGPPNFVLDVFPRNDLQDYEHRRPCCERAGVVEYVALQDTEAPTYFWNRLVDGRFSLIETDDPGMIRSASLPGLWIPTDALKNRNWWSIMAATAQGVTRQPHHELMESIWKK